MRRRLPYWYYCETWCGFRVFPDGLPPVNTCGVYLIEELATGRCYIGASIRMRYRAMQLSNRDFELSYHIHKKGKGAFGFTALYQSICGYDGLFEAEASLIQSYDASSTGFNVVPSELDRTTGNRIANKREHVYAKIVEANRRNLAKPEVKAKLANATTTTWKNATIRKRRMDGHSKPEVREVMRTAKLGRIKVTDGTTERLIPPAMPIPPGWWRGRLPRTWVSRNQFSKD